MLYDGVCRFCHASVRFLIARDPEGKLKFASQQSAVGRTMMEKAGFDGLTSDTLILVADGKASIRSDAAIRILAQLGGPWKLMRVFRIVPRFLRDAAYALFARHRYRLFGKLDACSLPSPEHRSRFLDEGE